jgi:bifunctional DNase/RNase
MIGMSKVRVNGIGIREAGLHLRAKRKGKKRYISMGIPSDLAQDISAIFKKEYRPSNQFMYDLLELVNEKVKFLDIDELKSKYYTSTLHFSDSKLSPVQPSAGIKTCLISGGEIRIDKKLLRNIKDAELIDFNEIVQYKSEKKKISLNKKEYTKFNFDDVGNVTLII